MGFASEFKQFAIKGNVVDLAVGVIIGAAFGKIVDSVVNDLITPLVGIFFKADFSNIYIPLSAKVPKGLALADAKKLGPVFAWGNFLTVSLNFVILAFIVFLIVKGINALKRKEEAAPSAPAAPSKEEVLLTEIRDLLAKRV
ncbi:large conductance mechanosensitive channel protein MscL [Mucilaginibacter paludis]|uniref:Large-conductance mechanosensitive channel n=1 Tax=Mucilaginibacter paludis DSM 18603 TaxID=714943 RepID=H1YDJ2_9SPHI|nr:large conductance mechanosensitive channel protein MscL [Mucilaginibacter paludis]EHQ30201.1 Large-conductance mechanosensitive channel [Mucilaginibacter paludis DSM 18603]